MENTQTPCTFDPELASRISGLNTNEMIDALHAHGIAPAGRYGAANAIADDREHWEKELLNRVACACDDCVLRAMGA